MIVIVRTTAGREKQVMDRLYAKVVNEKLPIYSIMKPQEVRGYIFVEAEDKDEVNQAVFGIRHVRGVMRGETKLEEVKHFLTPVPTVINIIKNDIVELVSGPFKGEKAKVSRINKTKGEIVVELLEAAVPIPIITKIDSVRVIRREEKEAESS